MAGVTPLIHSFNTGERSAAGLARVDQEDIRLAAEIQENILPHVVGKGLFRPGSQYIATTKSSNQARYLPFVKATDDTALIELTDAVMRVVVDDALVTRASVTSTVTNGDFSSGTGWTLTTSGDATANINSSVSGALYMACPNRGGTASCVRSVTTSDADTEHALRIEVTRGPVVFRCGSSSGADDYISETELETGTHSLAFTPSGTYYVFFSTTRETGVIVDSITVESSGVMEIAAPWATAELRSIQWDQSVDVIFLAHENWQQRKIERRGTTSWSLVLYKTDDGPFTLARTAKVRLKPAATRGNTTITAESAFFSTDHLGAPFRLTHNSYSQTFGLGGEESFTDPWRVSGVRVTDAEDPAGNGYDDRNWQLVISSTWSGALTVQRSFDGEDVGFVDFRRDTTSSTTTSISTNGTYANTDNEDNLIVWYRVGFEAGNYTSGAPSIALTYDGGGGFGIGRVTAVNGSSSVDVEVLSDFNNTVYTAAWLEGEWSEKRGWPTAVQFHDGRLGWFRGDRFWLSESDNYVAFNLETEGDSGSIQKDITTSGAVNKVNWAMSLQRLIIGTDGAEVSARASSFDEPLTPTACTLKNASTIGSNSVTPVKIDRGGLYVDNSGTRVYELLFEGESLDYDSQNLMRLNEDIGVGGIVALAVQRKPETYVWCVRADGEIPVLLRDRREKVAGWARVISDGASGTIEDVVVLPGDEQDQVYWTANRVIGGSTVRYLEKLAKHSQAIGGTTCLMADSFAYSTASSTTATVAHLAGESDLIGWGVSTGGVGTVLTSLTASSTGGVDLGGTYTNVCVGLAYDWRYKSAKLAYGAQKGTALLQNKIIPMVGLLLANTHRDAISVGPSFSTAELTPFRIVNEATGQALDDDEAVVDTYDGQIQPFGGKWNTDARVHMKGSAPYPATLLGLVIGMDTNER